MLEVVARSVTSFYATRFRNSILSLENREPQMPLLSKENTERAVNTTVHTKRCNVSMNFWESKGRNMIWP